MRAVITGSGLVTALVLCILVHCSIISANIRDNEVYSGMNQAMDYALDVMGDVYMSMDYQPEHEEEYVEMLTEKFCMALNQRIATDGEIFVALVYADMENGRFDIVVKESYSYPLKGKKGVCCCEKAVAFG